MEAGSASHRHYTIRDYLRLEAYSNVRHEYVHGEIHAMAGGTPEHGTYAANVIASLSAQLRERPCRVQTSDVRIRVKATGIDTYPDVSVVCSRAELDTDDPDAITNPTLLVEVLSASTEEYDRGEKFEHYKRLPSLQEVVFVAHDEWRIEVHRRRENQWERVTARKGETVGLQSIACELAVDEVYRDPLR